VYIHVAPLFRHSAARKSSFPVRPCDRSIPNDRKRKLDVRARLR